MKLVVGLGNPGTKYRMTRHNAGFMVLAELAKHRLPGVAAKSKFHAEAMDFRSKSGEQILMLAPVTFMNRSGLCVNEAVRFYKTAFEDILVVCDDLNLPFNKLRLRSEGSSGGQKGLADILKTLGTEKIPRLRVGVGQPPGQMDAADYVLMNFTEKERTDLEVTLKIAADAVMCWIENGIDDAMNKYN
ncbi:MAG: aminoacyl-tRNA hydrolase [Planctomycetaceae bacterium]|jgi:PTH1 family peptidyl-tRNA hydrolase|nr:aminoacyl-tRNA hydrolase [Planctomycetaceae bacterium]